VTKAFKYLILYVFLAPYAAAEIVDFKPLGLFFSDQTHALGLGRPDTLERRVDTLNPIGLQKQPNQIKILTERELIYNDQRKDGQFNTLRSDTKSAFVLFGFHTAFFGQTTFAFQGKLFESSYNFPNNQEEQWVAGSQSIDNSANFMLTSRVHPNIPFGVGFTIQEGQSSLFRQIGYAPHDDLLIFFRQYPKAFNFNARADFVYVLNYDFDLRQGGVEVTDTHTLKYELINQKDINELGIQYDIPAFFDSKIDFTLDSSFANLMLKYSVKPLSKLTITYLHKDDTLITETELGLDNKIGNSDVSSEYHLRYLDISYQLTDYLMLYTGIGVTELDLETKGKIDVGQIKFSSLLPSVSLSELQFAALGQVSTRYFRMGGSLKLSDFFNISSGVQLYKAAPQMQAAYILTLNDLAKLAGEEDDKGATDIDIDSVSIAGVTLGFNIKYKQWKINYTLAQLIPLTINYKKSDGTIDEQPFFEDDGESILDTALKDPGGNIQQLSMTYSF
jgi:hypothetical protein